MLPVTPAELSRSGQQHAHFHAQRIVSEQYCGGTANLRALEGSHCILYSEDLLRVRVLRARRVFPVFRRDGRDAGSNRSERRDCLLPNLRLVDFRLAIAGSVHAMAEEQRTVLDLQRQQRGVGVSAPQSIAGIPPHLRRAEPGRFPAAAASQRDVRLGRRFPSRSADVWNHGEV